MKCPKCGFDDPDAGTDCRKCGIVFDKYLRRHGASAKDSQKSREVISPQEVSQDKEEKWHCGELFFHVDVEAGNFSLAGRALIFGVLLIWGIKLIFSSIESNYSGQSLLHLVNLPFHEAGHILFRPLGRFMATLGGSLTQLLVPFICLAAFLFKTRDTFGASVSLWWFGENLIDLAPYINDARDLNLVLLGGVTGKDVDDFHDWEFILRKLDLLAYDHILAKTAHVTGALLMICAVFWGGYLLLRQFRNRHRRTT